MLPVTGQPGVPQNDVAGVWATTIQDGLRDEESCWWSTWCCCLVSGRTAEAFQLGSSYQQTWGFVSFILISVLVFLFVPVVGILLLMCGLLYYAYYKAQLRTRIRDLHQIPGTLTSDFVLHAFMPCCAVAQEAREAIAKGRPQLDFVYGENLSAINFPQVEMGGYMPSTPTGMDASTHEDATAATSLMEHLKSVSMLSHLILRLWLCIVAATFIALIVAGKGLNVLVLIAVFVQPFLILYFVYWRDPQRTKHVSLDYVIKLFAVGFFMSTTQSIVFESILEGVLGLVVSIILHILNPHMSDEDSNNNNTVAVGAEVKAFLQPVLSKYHWAEMINSAFTHTYLFLTNTYTTYDTTTSYTNTDVDTYTTYTPYHPTSHTTSFTTSETENDESQDDVAGYSSHIIRKNIVLIVFALFIMAFAIAAGVEETMKHFAVRCCRFPAPLRDPKSVLVYLMTAALGFATSENIEYVFGASKSPIPHTSLVVGELVVLAMRICMPIHVICSVMQATSLSKVLMGHANLNVFQILLPAVVLHGTFDFVLFLMGVIGAAYDVNEVALGVFSYFLPIFITLSGVYLAYTGFQSVLQTFESGWQTIGEATTGPVYL